MTQAAKVVPIRAQQPRHIEDLERIGWKVRLATNEEPDALRDLAASNGFNFEESGWIIDWSDVYPWWIVVEDRDDVIQGMMQVCAAKPIGRMEFMCVSVELHNRLRSIVVRALIDQGMATLRTAGCQGASGLIPFERTSYKKVAKKRGWVVICSGNNLLKRLV